MPSAIKRHFSLVHLQVVVVATIVSVCILYLLAPDRATASEFDPHSYTIIHYTYAGGLKLVNGLPDINHGDDVTLAFHTDTHMDMVGPDTVSEVRAWMYYLNADGTRELEHIFYDDTYLATEYAWHGPGYYEVNILGKIGTSSTEHLLATMEFSVNLHKLSEPTCTLTASPGTIEADAHETVELQWTSAHADTAVFDQGLGTVATSGSQLVSPTTTTTYTLTVTGQRGSETCTTTVSVHGPELPLHEQAAEFARQLVNNPNAYLWGGKGWDYDLAEFTTPERILSGYTYYNPTIARQDVGIGVDCSGLITWAFNRAFASTTNFTNNFVQYVNADGMFRDHQSDPVAEADLRPGDTLSFDWDGDGYMDHVAMYVGESGGYDVVNASSPDIGIREETKNGYKMVPGFAGYRRIHQAKVELAVTTGSPVDLVVTDPAGQRLDHNTVIASDEEFIREIPGELYYIEYEQGHDGRPIDRVVVPVVQDGVYTIAVVPEPGADSTATYSLKVEVRGESTTIVSDELVSTIPPNGFTLELTNDAISDVLPTELWLLEDLHQTISELTLSSPQRQSNLLKTTDAAIDWYHKDRLDQVERKVGKLQRDIEKHVAEELTVEELEDITEQIDTLLVLLSV